MRGPARASRISAVEWPTLLLAVAVYGGWLLATLYHAGLPGWLLPFVGGWLIAWQGSLQHETIHGHPTPNRTVNALIGAAPLSLWLPYAVYRRTHLAHHATEAVTDPFEDPESRYLADDERLWTRAALLLEATQATLAGRLLLGPPVTIGRSLIGESARLVRTPIAVLRDWLPHLAGVALVLIWLDHVGLTLGRYGLCFVYPGTALSLLRSFAEHRADPLPDHRVAIVERAGPFALLFLHNNLHAAHHRAPGLPWFRLPGFYRANRSSLLAGNGGLIYAGYRDVARRYLLHAHDTLIHPDHARPAP
ncbi:fatty acid desaturase [Sphingomonas sp. BIUV-7]|uniref:Fatty acid desaturase n=1 Tax=Sphingomonas natans TaxID=3063330 RepID=A0ABT8Y9L0_9SPHN|nr:fatty acid desaturase [Sphingomonas sp. BIUV-7]MDO6415022.1 fatty acid desaturase [Sphingomonas sp. BIUV-7]